jgi:hypothetical protein
MKDTKGIAPDLYGEWGVYKKKENHVDNLYNSCVFTRSLSS